MYIELADMCEVFNCLPQAGGLLDQHPLTMKLMLAVRAARADKMQRDQKFAEAKRKLKGL